MGKLTWGWDGIDNKLISKTVCQLVISVMEGYKSREGVWTVPGKVGAGVLNK